MRRNLLLPGPSSPGPAVAGRLLSRGGSRLSCPSWARLLNPDGCFLIVNPPRFLDPHFLPIRRGVIFLNSYFDCGIIVFPILKSWFLPYVNVNWLQAGTLKSVPLEPPFHPPPPPPCQGCSLTVMAEECACQKHDIRLHCPACWVNVCSAGSVCPVGVSQPGVPWDCTGLHCACQACGRLQQHGVSPESPSPETPQQWVTAPFWSSRN